MSDRGMKKWAPYKSLNEQWSTLDQIKKEEIKEKPKISNEKAEEINDILVNYEGQELTIRYFRKGQALEEKSAIKKIDTFNKKLFLENGVSIYLKEIFDII